MKPNLQFKLDNLPLSPGVYLFKNEKSKVIYVGKAKVLRPRVRSYFTGSPDGRAQFEALVSAIADVEVIVTESEIEALILEASLIKRYRPRFNVFMRDDKFFPFLKVTKELFPQVFLTRKVLKDGSEYYGPFTEVREVRYLIKTFKSAFQIRNCSLDITLDSIAKKKHKICLDYHIDLCGGACEGLVEANDYLKGVRKLVSMVKGEVSSVIKELRHEMLKASEALRFEQAILLRDKLRIVEEFSAKQTIIFPDKIDRDVFGLAKEDDDGCVVVMKVREGRIQGREHFFIKGTLKKSNEEIVNAFLKQYYFASDYTPPTIYAPAEPEDWEILLQWLKVKRQGAVDITVPQRGGKTKLMRMANSNAELLLGEKRREIEARDKIQHSVRALQENLHLAEIPQFIEAFDIYNIQGAFPIASMVVFKNGKPLKSEYRSFNIKTVEGIDDYAMIAEAVKRRYSRLLREGKELPHLILIDGGKGQLSSAFSVLRELNITNIPIIGLAKRLEEIFLPLESEAINLPKTSSALKLLQQVRDEAHRFAITRHRTQRGKNQLHSTLDNIPGVGDSRKKLLLKHFGSIKRIIGASLNDLHSIKGLDKRTAQAIFDYFRR
jgi:excinuclease ABC subunit C